ncbi:MAG: PD-(D/E)XK nuclease family protein [Prolixibacteraceae bacterium]
MEKQQKLLNQVKTILNHHKEIERIKGESFNVFSVLKMETRENATHSAFLAELLNPEGSHIQGNLFIKLFFKIILNETITSQNDESINIPDFDLDNATVIVEKHIGERDDTKKTGGRVDIYLSDKKGNSICIENKINAGDQFAQIERYCNHNTNKNLVIYLNLDGKFPSEDSRGKLEPGKDFLIISYKEHIIQWLQLCLKEAAEIPILRESIKQYILIIKKLTNTMSDQFKTDIHRVIIDNYEECESIFKNFENAFLDISRKIREEIKSKLCDRIGDEFILLLGSDPKDPYSTIWIKAKGKEETKLFFGIQSFSRSTNGFKENMYVGIFVFKCQFERDYEKLGEHNSDCWLNIVEIPDLNENDPANLKSIHTIRKLKYDPKFRDQFVNHIVNYTVQYVNENKSKLLAFLNDV